MKTITPTPTPTLTTCTECMGAGDKCHSGSAHPLNWYECPKCHGKGTVIIETMKEGWPT